MLVEFLSRNTEELTRNWMRIVRNHQLTRSYGAFDEDRVYERAFRMYDQLRRWVGREFTKGDIASYYTALGAKRRREGFDLAEVVRALIVARRVLWFKIQAEGFIDKSIPADLALEINNRVVLFFDRAIYYSTVGYEQK
jgi:hypothetical protein